MQYWKKRFRLKILKSTDNLQSHDKYNILGLFRYLRKASFLLGFFAETDKMLSGACSVSAESAIDDNHQKFRNISFHDVETNCQLYKCFYY